MLDEYAKAHTPAGAMAFAAYYFKALDWSTATTDPYLVQQIGGPECAACNRVISELTALAASGGHVERGRIRIEAAKLVTGTFKVASDYVVEVTASADAVVIASPSGAPSTSAPAVSNDVSLVFVSWVGRGWQVIEVGAPSS